MAFEEDLLLLTASPCGSLNVWHLEDFVYSVPFAMVLICVTREEDLGSIVPWGLLFHVCFAWRLNRNLFLTDFWKYEMCEYDSFNISFAGVWHGWRLTGICLHCSISGGLKRVMLKTALNIASLTWRSTTRQRCHRSLWVLIGKQRKCVMRISHPNLRQISSLVSTLTAAVTWVPQRPLVLKRGNTKFS